MLAARRRPARFDPDHRDRQLRERRGPERLVGDRRQPDATRPGSQRPQPRVRPLHRRGNAEAVADDHQRVVLAAAREIVERDRLTERPPGLDRDVGVEVPGFHRDAVAREIGHEGVDAAGMRRHELRVIDQHQDRFLDAARLVDEVRAQSGAQRLAQAARHVELAAPGFLGIGAPQERRRFLQVLPRQPYHEVFEHQAAVVRAGQRCQRLLPRVERPAPRAAAHPRAPQAHERDAQRRGP